MARPKGTGKYKDGQVPMAEIKYDEKSHPERLLELMKQGYLNCQIFAAFGIHETRFYDWIKEYENFSQAYELGKPHCEAWWVDWGMRGMRGEVRGFNFNAWIAFMNNKFKWAKNTYGDQANNVTNNISVQQMNVLQSKDKDGLIEYIQRLGNKHKEVLNVEFTTIESTDSQSLGDDSEGTNQSS